MGTDIFLDDDFTIREQEIAAWLRNLEQIQIEKGAKTRTSYLKLCVNETWQQWNEETGKLEEVANKI